MSNILILRHGETAWSATKRIQGRTDNPLSERGRDQVRSWCLPKIWHRATCLSSPLRRAQQTASLLNLDFQIDQRLIEGDWGRYEGMTLKDLRADPQYRMTELEAAGMDFKPPKGESPKEVSLRIASIVDEASKTSTDQIWVAHKGIRNAALILATGWDMKCNPPVKIQNDQGLILACGHGNTLRLAGVLDLRAA